jgi:DNA polymerase-3 subunit epsilon
MKRFFFDLETTGVDWAKNAIHQIAIIIEINGKVVNTIDWRLKPFDGARIDDKALEVGNVTREFLDEQDDQGKVFKRLLRELGKHVDRFDRQEKFHLCGFNNRYFDDRFLRAWFERNDDLYFGAWFWPDSLDVMVLASQHLAHQRKHMKNFKLATVAETLGVKVDATKLHDGLYDVTITREAYNKITNADLLG